MANIRVGFGYDVHPLAEGTPMWLGGVLLEKAPKGAVGHSDADVLLHAICDAILGAANLRDIGFHFSNTDPQYKGISSLILLERTIELLHNKGWKLVNIDSMICLEEPKVNPHIPTMQQHISSRAKIAIDNISIKATTSEKLGFVGRTEGVTASAVVLIEKITV